MKDEAGAAAEDHQQDGGDEEEAADHHPENAESVEMAFEARLGDGADGVADLAGAVGADHEVGLSLGSAAVAEHSGLLGGRTMPLHGHARFAREADESVRLYTIRSVSGGSSPE